MPGIAENITAPDLLAFWEPRFLPIQEHVVDKRSPIFMTGLTVELRSRQQTRSSVVVKYTFL